MSLHRERGSTLIELLVAAGIFTGILGAVLSTFMQTSRQTYDENIISRTAEQARLALDLMTYDLRMAGAGMPLGQGGFVPGGAGLGDAPLPILLTTTATSIQFRVNEPGRVTVLASPFTPSPSNLTFSVFSSADLEVGDTIYISNATAGGSSGLKGVVSAKTSGTVTLTSSYVATTAATFESGSVVHRVTLITYDSPTAGISRNNEVTTLTIVPNSSFSLRFFDAAGNVITPPLTAAVVKNTLCAIEVSVSVPSSTPLRDGTTYTATARQRVAPRNLILSR